MKLTIDDIQQFIYLLENKFGVIKDRYKYVANYEKQEGIEVTRLENLIVGVDENDEFVFLKNGNPVCPMWE